ncbi:acyltransferase [Geotalea sp. SG265]|uniref:acyltransferase family protein n=1 Tax=Geotalea sp. SG265 TaxID=2922867 RepID=UPI001FAEF2DC|nr:acyltransferase [Geotalea sp. SG265]
MKNIDNINGFVPALDGIRGYAILLVIIIHTFHTFIVNRGYSADPGIKMLDSIAGFGIYGVDLFFVLSGFLITGILINQVNSNNYFKAFYIKRVLRIFPLYYIYLLAIVILVPLLVSYVRFNITSLYVYFIYLQNMFYSSGTLQDYLLCHLWSLAVEEHFYLIWPLIVYFIKPKKVIIISIVFIIIAIMLRSYIILYSHIRPSLADRFTLCRIDSIFFGCLLAYGLRSISFNNYLHKHKYVMLLISGLISLVTSLLLIWNINENIHHVISYTVYGVFFTAILNVVMFVDTTSLINKIFDNKLAKFFGKYSYSMYIIHMPITAGLYAIYFEDAPGYALLNAGIFFATTTGLTVIGSLISWHILEKHFIKLKIKLANNQAMQPIKLEEEQSLSFTGHLQ